MNIIGIFILAAVIVDYMVHFIADGLNLKKLNTALPQAFAGWYDEDRYAASQAYLRVNTRFERVAAAVNLLVFLLMWFGRGFPLLDGWVRTVSDGPVIRGLLYIGVLLILKSAIGLPFSIYSTFHIEEQFGFNRTTWKVFLVDRFKQFVLALILGGPVLAGVLAFFQYAGSFAWGYCWMALSGFIFFMQVAVPAWILPLFNKFYPLSPGKLKTAILNYADSIDFPVKKIFIMDGSRRSRKSNAFFTGFGRHRRIVLYDTLVKNHDTDELVAVLAHEMGHYKKKHVLWMLVAGIAQTGLMLYLLSLFISSPVLHSAFYMETPSVYAGLVFFGILFAPIEFFIGIAMQYVSRKHEYAADRFAVLTTGRPAAFSRALKKLAVHNLSNLTPHPVYVMLNYSHPPVMERLEEIGKLKAQS